MRPRLLPILFVASTLLGTSARGEHEDCDSKFIAFVGTSSYQFSPSLQGELGRVRLFSILSYQGAAADKDFGAAYWRLEIRGPQDPDRLVRSSRGMVRIDARGAGVVDFIWDGRDEDGNLVEPGTYQYTFSGRFLPDRIRPTRSLRSYDDLRGMTGVDSAQETTRNVIVDYTLSREASRFLRQSLVSTSCQIQQNASIEAGFPYNFYYGSTHSHSNYSDGGQPTTGCSVSDHQ